MFAQVFLAFKDWRDVESNSGPNMPPKSHDEMPTVEIDTEA